MTTNNKVRHDINISDPASYHRTLGFLQRQDLDPNQNEINFGFSLRRDDDYLLEEEFAAVADGLQQHASKVASISLNCRKGQLGYESINRLGDVMQGMTNLTSFYCYLGNIFGQQDTFTLQPFIRGLRGKSKLRYLVFSIRDRGLFDEDGVEMDYLFKNEISELSESIKTLSSLESIQLPCADPPLVSALIQAATLENLLLDHLTPKFCWTTDDYDYELLAQLCARLSTLSIRYPIGDGSTRPLPVHQSLQNHSTLSSLHLTIVTTDEFDCFQIGEVIRLNQTIEDLFLHFEIIEGKEDHSAFVARAVALNVRATELHLTFGYGDSIFRVDLQEWVEALRQNLNITKFTIGNRLGRDERIEELDTVYMMQFYVWLNGNGRKELIQQGTRLDWVEALSYHAQYDNIEGLFCLLSHNPLLCDLNSIELPAHQPDAMELGDD